MTRDLDKTNQNYVTMFGNIFAEGSNLNECVAYAFACPVCFFPLFVTVAFGFALTCSEQSRWILVAF